jgi:TonB family protein
VHGIALLAIAPTIVPFLAGGGAPVPAAEPGAPGWIDVVPPPVDPTLPELPDPAGAPPQAQLPPARLDDAPQGDAEHDPAHPRSPHDGDTHVRRAPAPDAGRQQGTTATHASRRDRSTLRDRLTDGASLYQPSRRRTSGAVSSPQAVRRESVTGIGDAVHSAAPARAASEPARTAPDAPAAGDVVLAQPGDEAPRPVEPVAIRPELPHPTAVAEAPVRHGVGALDSEHGARSFDQETPGRAADDRDQRAASDEMHPGITDLSRPGVHASVETPQGRGPAAVVPGVVAHPSDGAAPGRYGAPAAAQAQAGPDVDERTQDRRYQRYIQEIARRVNSYREFPKGLALRLEQGETVVRFVLGTDGRISDGVKVQKSSGFDEFDEAATRAVQRAAPFPPMPPTRWARPLPVSVRVAFENPLVR